MIIAHYDPNTASFIRKKQLRYLNISFVIALESGIGLLFFAELIVWYTVKETSTKSVLRPFLWEKM